MNPLLNIILMVAPLLIVGTVVAAMRPGSANNPFQVLGAWAATAALLGYLAIVLFILTRVIR